ACRNYRLRVRAISTRPQHPYPPFRPASFFFSAPPASEIHTLSLHDALPISVACLASQSPSARGRAPRHRVHGGAKGRGRQPAVEDRKSTRLNSSHLVISYAVFCLKKKNQDEQQPGHNARIMMHQGLAGVVPV